MGIKNCGCSGVEAVYRWDCIGCMARKIKMLRSRDGKTSRKLQVGTFERMGEQMAQQVKQILASEVK